MKVLKFGGSSISSFEGMDNVIRIISGQAKNNQPIWVVFSAFSGVTDALEKLAHLALERNRKMETSLDNLRDFHLDNCKKWLAPNAQSTIIPQVLALFNELDEILHGIWYLRECSPRTLDFVRSFGERLSASIINEVLKGKGIHSHYVDSREFMKTDEHFGAANVLFEESGRRIRPFLDEKYPVIVTTGFIGSTLQDETTTLGRNGSDYSAAVIASLLPAKELQIWTDVDGVMTADPSCVKKAFTIPVLSYEEAMELSHFGAKVIHARTTQPVRHQNIPIYIKNTFHPDFPGTCIQASPGENGRTVKGISSIEHLALMNLTGPGMVGVCGIAARLFSCLAQNTINIILISQASSEHSICFAIDEADIAKAKEAVSKEFEREMLLGMIKDIQVEKGKAIVAIVGERMKRTAGIAGRLFQSLGKNGINVYAIAQGSSELNISAVISSEDLDKALNTIHDAFFLSSLKTAHLFLIGPGLIGSTVLELLKGQKEMLARQYNLEISLNGIINTSKALISKEGIGLHMWEELFHSRGVSERLESFVEKIFDLNLPNAILVDCTSSEEVVRLYPELLSHHIAVVTPNKKANSSDYAFYHQLLQLSRQMNVPYLYETNVGAGLPIIQTIRDLIMSGDKIIRIEGILSGTMNFIFSRFMDSDMPFSAVVQQALEKGYTEPHPEDDLNGMDVGRKILILARESGYPMEMDQVEIQSLIPQEATGHLPLDQFFTLLKAMDPHMDAMRKNARNRGMVLRYTASFAEGRAIASLKEVPMEHPFARIEGSDNVVALTTLHYGERPLIVQGAGAGARVTASGVVADIIKAANLMGG